MNTAKADDVVLTSLALTGILAIADKVTVGDSPDVVRVAIGVFLSGVFLTFAAQWQPELAAMLAVLALIAAVVKGGPGVWNALVHRIAPPTIVVGGGDGPKK